MDTDTLLRNNERTLLPPEDLETLLDVSNFLDRSGSDAMLLGPDGEQVSIPMEVYRVLCNVVEAMAQRQAIAVMPIDQKLTTQSAADYLGVSRPTLIKLLESGEIPYEKLPQSRHRRVLLVDLLKYQQRMQEKRHAIFAQLTEDAEADGLYLPIDA